MHRGDASVLLLGNYSGDKQESMLRFGVLLRDQLFDKGVICSYLQPPVILGSLAKVNGRAQKWLGYLDKYLLFPFLLIYRSRRFSIIHISDHSNALYIPFIKNKRSIVTCHDLIAVKSALGETKGITIGRLGRFLQRRILSGLKAASVVIADSEATKADVCRLAGRNQAEVKVVGLPLNYPYARSALQNAENILKRGGLNVTKPFLLHVGGNQWYKNRLGVLRIFHEFSLIDGTTAFRLVMAGQIFSDEMRSEVKRLGLKDRVIELIKPSNEELNALYSLADAFIFPSLQEGFGWPVLEAQACGCPVVTSNRVPMIEVAGDAAIFIDPTDEAAAAACLLEALRQSESLRIKGFINIQRFSADAMIDQYRHAYFTA